MTQRVTQQQSALYNYKTGDRSHVSSFLARPRSTPGIAGVLRPRLFYRAALKDRSFERPNLNIVVNDLKGPDIVDPGEDVLDNFSDPITEQTPSVGEEAAAAIVAIAEGAKLTPKEEVAVKQEIKQEIKEEREEHREEAREGQPFVPPQVPPPQPQPQPPPEAILPKKLSQEQFQALAVKRGPKRPSVTPFRSIAKKPHKFRLV